MNIRTLTLSTLLTPALFFTDAAAQSPAVFLSDTSFSPTVDYQGNGSVNLTIGNSGDTPLEWEIKIIVEEDSSFDGQPLEDTLRIFDRQFTNVTDLIPNRFDFTEGVTGDEIIDGGQDMFDFGNQLQINNRQLAYSDGIFAESNFFNGNIRYFTRKYPGLFLLASEIDGNLSFEIGGNFGSRLENDSHLELINDRISTEFRGLVLQHMGAFNEPSVNYLFIIPDGSGIIHELKNNRALIRNLFNVKRLYYLLYSAKTPTIIDDEQTQQIFEAVLKIINPRTEWLDVSQNTGTVQPGSAGAVTLTFDAKNLLSESHSINLQIESNDPNNAILSIPVTLTVQDPEPQNISVFPIQFDFDSVALGSLSSLPLTITNTGEDFLRISNVILNGDKFSIEDFGEIQLDNGESIELPINFIPDVQGDFTGTITINSNDLNFPEISLGLSGGSRESETSQSSSELNLALEKDQSFVKPINMTNSGEGILQWSLGNPEFLEEDRPLEEVMETFNRKFEAVTNLIPNRFDFDGGNSGWIIEGNENPHEGGIGMYFALGNSIYPVQNQNIMYSPDTISSNSRELGMGGRYFTNKYPGLFLFAGDINDLEYFEIRGDTTTFGEGSTDGIVLDYKNGFTTTYLKFAVIG